jgi:uncharacterized damage-inducible protein DinB
MIRDLLLPEFDQEVATLRSLVASMPDASLDWKPHPKSFSLRELASHLVNIPSWLPMTMDTSELDFGAQPDVKTHQIDSTAHALELLGAAVGAAREKLLAATDQGINETWTLRAGPHVLFTGAKYDVIRAYVINHLVHHRGQLSVYLRLLDVPLEKIYGPTADSNWG